ncbi:MAG TPA: hypothetical protein VF111_06635 [Thermoanaerobaculia bacterium]
MCWLVGALAFGPVLSDVYGAPDNASRQAAIAAHLVPWIVQNLLFFAGVVAAAFGLSRLVTCIGGRGHRIGRMGRALLWLAVLAWTILFFGLIATPLGVPFAKQIVTRTFWMAAAFTTLAAFVMIGLSLMASRAAIVAGAWMAVASALLFCAVIAMRTTLPPLLFFQVLLVAGLALIRKPALCV